VTKRWFAAAVLAVALAVAGWIGWRATRPGTVPVAASVAEQDVPAARPATETIETVDAGTDGVPTAGTPMAQRVAVIGLLNKRNSVSRELTLKPGQAVRIGDAIVRLRACERTAPWEDATLTGAFVQLDVRGADRTWRRAFSGWLFKERPALNVAQHPIYDVWTKSCAMSFPDGGPDTVPVGTLQPRSSAPKSPAPADSGEPMPTTPDSASPSNAT
jgi:hypothetical protein